MIYQNEIAKETKYLGYFATKSGKIISVKVKGSRGKIDLNNPREHCYKTDRDGYLEVCLSESKDGIHKRVYMRVHRLVWETFNGEIPKEMTVDHIDRDKKNNSLENLRLLSRADNARIANKGKKSSKRYIYTLYKNEENIGNFDRKELCDMLGLINKDFYKSSIRTEKTKKRGYKWIKTNVEDIERIS